MSKKVFDGIMAGLKDALADVRGEPGHVVKVTTIAPLDVKSVREKTGLSQEDFSRTFGVPLATYRKWEQGQSYGDSALNGCYRIRKKAVLVRDKRCVY